MLLELPTAVLAVLIVGASVALSLVGLWLFVRLFPGARRAENNEVFGVVSGMVGVVYAILLAFIVVVVWGQFTDAEQRTQVEVTRISNLLRDAEPFPPPARDQVHRRLVRYLEAVIDEEWETMSEGKSSPVASRLYEDVWEGYYRFEPRSEKQNHFYQESLTRLNELGESRRLRLLSSRASVPSVMWVLLIAGGVVTIAFSYVFWFRSLRAQALGVATLAGLTGFVLFLIFALEHPFAGDIRVTPHAFEDLLELWRHRAS